MRNTFTVLFYLKKESKEIEKLIFTRISINSRRTQFSTRLKIEEKSWDQKNQQAKGRTAKSNEINNALTTWKSKICNIITRSLVKKDSLAWFFNLINTLHENASLIITTNKAPTEWAKTLDDEVFASAILNRLLYRCEVIKLSGQSYSMRNRKSIFNKK